MINIFLILILISALGVILSINVVQSVLNLIIVFFICSILLINLGADYLGLVILIVYIGVFAVAVLFIMRIIKKVFPVYYKRLVKGLNNCILSVISIIISIFNKIIEVYKNLTYAKIKLIFKTLRICYKSYTISALIIKLSVYTAAFIKSGHIWTVYPVLGILVNGMLDEALNKDPNLQRLLNSDPDLKAEADKNNGYFSESQKKWIKYFCLTAAVGLVVGITWWLSKYGGSGSRTESTGGNANNGDVDNVPVSKSNAPAINDNDKMPVNEVEVGGPRGPRALEMASSELLASKASKLVGAVAVEKVVENLQVNTNTIIGDNVNITPSINPIVESVKEQKISIEQKSLVLEAQRMQREVEELKLNMMKKSQALLKLKMEKEQADKKALTQRLMELKMEEARKAACESIITMPSAATSISELLEPKIKISKKI